MQFYEFFEKICGFIPDQYEGIQATAEIALPWLFGIFALATCFCGQFMHKVWNVCLFFVIGFFVPLFILFVLFQPEGRLFTVFEILCLALGIVCAYYAQRLHRIRVAVTTFLMVYIAAPSFLKFLGGGMSVFVGFLLAIILAFVSVKYKYLTVMATTSFTGAMLFWGMVASKTGMSHVVVMLLTVLVGAIGLAVQCYIERKELKKSLTEVKEVHKKAKEYKRRKNDGEDT